AMPWAPAEPRAVPLQGERDHAVKTLGFVAADAPGHGSTDLPYHLREPELEPCVDGGALLGVERYEERLGAVLSGVQSGQFVWVPEAWSLGPGTLPSTAAAILRPGRRSGPRGTKKCDRLTGKSPDRRA